jgi:hypothetical protein
MKWCVIGFALVFGVLAISSHCLPEWTTQYATPSVKRNFSSVQLGTTLDGLYKQLGKPFLAVILQNGGRGPVIYDHDVTSEHLRERMRDEDIMLWLQYSRNNGPSRWYNRYEIEMQNNRVIHLNGDDFQD